MALREKLSNLAASATSRANSAIESGKLNIRIGNEEKKITEFTLNVGELLVDKLDAGETFDDEIMALYASIQASRDVIAQARTDLDANKPASPTPVVSICANCGAPLAENAKFCSSCGAKVEAPVEPQEESPDQPVCAQCGAPLEAEANFCNQCGAKVEKEAAPEAGETTTE